MDINSYEKVNNVDILNAVSVLGNSQYKENDFITNVSHVSSSEEQLTLIKSKTDNSEVTEEHARCSILKKIIKYILGISILSGGLYSMLKLSSPKNMFNDNALKSNNDSHAYWEEIQFYFPNKTEDIRQSVRKLRHIDPEKNQPYKYYYIQRQIEKCKQESFLNKCREEHQRVVNEGFYYQRLILNVDDFPCYCPPPDINKVNMILPTLNYTYTDDQPAICKSQNIIDDCEKEFIKLEKEHDEEDVEAHVNVMTIKTKNITCYCPPSPLGAFVNFYPPEVKRRRIIANTQPIKKEDVIYGDGEPFIVNEQKRVSFALIEKKQIIDSSEYKVITDDGVSFKKMYDLSCVEEGEDINLSRAFEIMAEAFKKPISSLAAESMKIHHYNTLHLGCPSKKSMKEIDGIADIADKYLNVAIQLLPYNTGLIIAKNIISPLLMALSKTLDNKPIDIDSIDEINSNIRFIFQDFVRSISGDYAKHIGKMNEKAIENNVVESFNDKFKVNEDGVNIIYNNEINKLNFDIKNRPYINIDNKFIFVGYDSVNKKWGKLNSDYMHFYSDENIDNANKYRCNNVVNDFVYNIENAKNSAEIQQFFSTHQFELLRVVIGDNIIPVYKISFFSGEDTFMTAVVNLPKKIIVKTPYGFVFDKESTDVSYILGLYIDSNINGEVISEDNIYTKIHDDKLSYDYEGNAYIKYRGLYYRVDLFDKDNNIYSMTSEIDYDEIYIKLKGAMFDFHESSFFYMQDIFKNNPSFLSKIKDGYFDSTANPHEIMPIRSEEQHSGYIYFKSYAELLTNGEEFDGSITDLSKLDPLIYWDKKSKSYFLNVNNKLYVIEKNTDVYGVISIKNKNHNKDNIEIYRYDDFLIQVKEEKPRDEYFRLTNCKSKRSVTDISCKSIYISSELKRKLDNNIRRSRSSVINDEDIRVFDSELGLFERKGKFYYAYEGRFFEIKLNKKETNKNKFSGTIIDVYANSIFRNKRKIASFISVNKDDRIEIKEPDVFLSEATGNEVSDMRLLLENKKYYEIKNIFEVNNSINEVNRSKKLTIVLPKPPLDITMRHDQIMSSCRERFYNNRNDIDFNILEIDQITHEDDFYLWSGKIKVVNHIKYAHDVVSNAIKVLKKPSKNVDEYLKSILNTDNKEIIKQFSESLRAALDNTLKKLDSKVIDIVSAIREPYEDSPTIDVDDNVKVPVHYKKVLDEKSLRDGVFAFTTRMKNSRIYVCIDKFYFIDPTHPDQAMHQSNAMDLAETLIHEATHTGYGTIDSYYIPLEQDGLLQSIVNSKYNFINSIPTMSEKSFDALGKIVKEYVEKIALYDRWKMQLLTDRSALAFFISQDTGIMANIYLNNADFLTKICKDIYHLNVVDKDSLHYYSHFVNAVNTMALPVRNFLDLDLDIDPMEMDGDPAPVLDELPASAAKKPLLDTIKEEEEPDDGEEINPVDQTKNEVVADIHPVPNLVPASVAKNPSLDTIKEEEEPDDGEEINSVDQTKLEVVADVHPVPNLVPASVAKNPSLDTIKEEEGRDNGEEITPVEQTKYNVADPSYPNLCIIS